MIHSLSPLTRPIDRPYLTDGGQETTLVFHEGVDLPCFAAFPLLESSHGRDWFRAYYDRYIDLAERFRTGFVLESATWRANRDWGARLGYDASGLERANRAAIGLLHEIRERRESPEIPMLVSGCVGPRGDGYAAGTAMSADEAAAYHLAQIRSLHDAGADLITAMTMTSLPEARGVAEAAASLGVPAVVSFTVETDGRLPDGHHLRHAITTIDTTASVPPVYYMINCAHPTHFAGRLDPRAEWTRRLGGLRANASCRSHAELDASPDLDIGDPRALGAQYRALRDQLPALHVLGGCCGTDERHLAAIGKACFEIATSSPLLALS
ncbi:MAG: homocysteine S-methyltransferase family protein [Verrucomicrobiales bacterium]